MVADLEIARVEIALGSDPDLMADPASATDPAVDYRLVADHHAVADLKRLGMPDTDLRTQRQPVSAMSHQRSKAASPKRPREVVGAAAEALQQILELRRSVVSTELLRQLDLEPGIRLWLVPAMDGPNNAVAAVRLLRHDWPREVPHLPPRSVDRGARGTSAATGCWPRTAQKPGNRPGRSPNR